MQIIVSKILASRPSNQRKPFPISLLAETPLENLFFSHQVWIWAPKFSRILSIKLQKIFVQFALYNCRMQISTNCKCFFVKKNLLQWSVLSSTTIFLHSEHQIAKCIQLNMKGEKNSVKLQTIFFPTWKSLLLPSSPELSTTIFSHIEHRYISLQIGVTNYWYWGRLGWTKILTNGQWPSCFYRYWKVKVQTCSCDIQMSLFLTGQPQTSFPVQ